MRFLFYVGRLGHRKPNLYVFGEIKEYFVNVFRCGTWGNYHKTQKFMFFKKVVDIIPFF